MSYGLYDGDIAQYGSYPFFNLDLMKLSTYYKKKREIVSLAPSFVPNKYTHFIYQKDFYCNGIYPSFDNVIYRGRAFDGETYKPMESAIEICKPDTGLYDKLEPNFNKTSFSIMRRAEHMRLSMDGKTIWKNFEKQIRREPGNFGLILHDYDIGQIEGAYDLIVGLLPEIITHTKGRRIGMKFPLYTNELTDLTKWLQLPPLNQFYSVIHNGKIPPSYYEQLVELRPNSSAVPQLRLHVTNNTTYDQFITQDVVDVFKMILDLRRRKINFLLVYDKDFFTEPMWIDVLQAFNQFILHNINLITHTADMARIGPYETFYSYVKDSTKNAQGYFNKFYAQRLFQFVRENNYELFTLFYEYEKYNLRDEI